MAVDEVRSMAEGTRGTKGIARALASSALKVGMDHGGDERAVTRAPECDVAVILVGDDEPTVVVEAGIDDAASSAP